MSPPIRGIGKLGSALDATVVSGVLQEAAARDYRGSGHCSTGGQHQTEEPGFPVLQLGPGMAQAACSNPSTMGIAISQ
jgi:hypothetical protein